MRESSLNQKTRFVLLVIEFGFLCLASWFAFGHILPPNGDKGFWFYTALLGLILGVRLDTPFFVTPADAIINSSTAAVALALGNSWDKWGDGEKVAFVVAVFLCTLPAIAGVVAIWTKDSKQENSRQTSNTAKLLAEKLGSPKIIYSVVILFALYTFHRDSVIEFGIIFSVWALTAMQSPLEGCIHIARRIRRIWKRDVILDADGEVIAYQTPNIILVRQTPKSKIKAGDLVAVHDPLGGTRIALALDYVGRDEGILLRTIEVTDVSPPSVIHKQLSELPANSVAHITEPTEELISARVVTLKTNLVGLIAPESTIEKIFFEVVQGDGLEEGRLVEVQIGKRVVTYQVVDGLTKEEIVQQKNTFGFARAQAQKIGVWNTEGKRFEFAKWLPQPNAPVFLKSVGTFKAQHDVVGYFPNTDYGVTLRVKDGNDVGLQSLVTHNTAILGILGVGKSTLALELVERMMAKGIKIVCVDLTKQYANELTPFFDAKSEAESIAKLQSVGKPGKSNVKKNVEEGGSWRAFAKAVTEDLNVFLNPENAARLKIYNPAEFEVWRQDSKPYQETASMASLTPAEITQIISEATLQVVSESGMTDTARVCLVYEEAHTLVPEWNSTVAEGDKAASNGTARAILQGRKYGLGCLLVTQRTANVTKTILNQCNTVFAMRTFDETGKDFLANYLGKDYANRLSSLQERHAVFFGRASSCENPVLIRVNEREDFKKVFREKFPPPQLPVRAVPQQHLAAPSIAAPQKVSTVPARPIPRSLTPPPPRPTPPAVEPPESDDVPF